MTRELHNKIDQLSNIEVVIVDDVVTAILSPVEEKVLEDSWLATPAWVESFSARLRAHHGLSIEPLGTLQFEAAFNHACAADGWDVAISTGATQRFFDTIITKGDTRKCLSLKSSAAKKMRKGFIDISKLTEGAWIQDARRVADRRDSIVALFKEYREVTDGIIILRAFREIGGVRYELIEIPTSIFEHVDNLTIEEAQRGTIPLPVGAVLPVFKIGIDRSDAKVKLTGVRLDAVSVHGEWKLQGEKLG